MEFYTSVGDDFPSENPEFFEERSSLNGHPNLEAHLEKN